MSWEWDDRYSTWLPPDQAAYVAEHEDVRFASLVSALQDVSAKIPAQEDVIRNPEVILDIQPWIYHINKCAHVRPGAGETCSLCESWCLHARTKACS
jgi:hypothetical protein